MLSRTADHLYWMARYIERAENTARMLDVNYQIRCCRNRPMRRAGLERGLLQHHRLTRTSRQRYGEVTPAT